MYCATGNVAMMSRVCSHPVISTVKVMGVLMGGNELMTGECTLRPVM